MKRGEKLEKIIKEKGYNAMSLSKVTDVPYTTIRSMIQRDLHNASIDNVIKICKVLGIKVEDLLEPCTESAVAESPAEYKTNTNKYQYVPAAISAGLPIGVEGIPESNIEEISIPNSVMGKWAGNDDIFIMRINGDSMNKVMPHGSLIAVKDVEPSQLKDSDIVVYSDGHEYAVKRFYRYDDKLIFRPDSTDLSFTDYVTSINNSDLKIHGKVVLYIVELD